LHSRRKRASVLNKLIQRKNELKQTNSQWIVGPQAWAEFVNLHPELGYKPGRMNFHNFLRNAKNQLLAADAIRLAKRKFWIAHQSRFPETAFEISTCVFTQTANAFETGEKNDQ
jgi:hypothetical protein